MKYDNSNFKVSSLLTNLDNNNRTEIAASLKQLQNSQGWLILSESLKMNIDDLTDRICDLNKSARRSEQMEAYIKAQRASYINLLQLPSAIIKKIDPPKIKGLIEVDPYKTTITNKEE